MVEDHEYFGDTTVAGFDSITEPTPQALPQPDDEYLESDYDFGIVLICSSSDQTIHIRNNNPTDTITIVNVSVSDSTGAFELLGVEGTRVTIPPTREARAFVRFRPTGFGRFHGTIHVNGLVKLVKSYAVLDDSARLFGESRFITTHAQLHGADSASTGDTIAVPLILHDPLDDAFITAFHTTLLYDWQNLTVAEPFGVDTMVAERGTLLEGWQITVMKNRPGQLELFATAPPAHPLRGAGTLYNLHFVMLPGRDLVSSICPTILFGNLPCARVLIDCKQIRRRSDDVVDQHDVIRFIGAAPNPADQLVIFRFALSSPAEARLAIFSADGRLVETLVDESLDEAGHTATWDVGMIPPGIYFYRLSAAGVTRTGPIMVWHK